MSWISWLISGISGLIHIISQMLDRARERELVDQGKQQATIEIANKISEKEAEVTKKQTEILMQERTDEETIKKLEKGEY